MIRSVERTARQAKIAALKRLIIAGNYETLEKLEEAVDAFLWREENPAQAHEAHEHVGDTNRDVRRTHPK